jgi:hypothetical protein
MTKIIKNMNKLYEYVESIDCFMNKIFLDSIYHSFEKNIIDCKREDIVNGRLMSETAKFKYVFEKSLIRCDYKAIIS